MNTGTLPIEADGHLSPMACDVLAERIKLDIDKACHDLYNEDEPRRHLGASVVGTECSRRVWYLFHWFKAELFSARMLRLFNRGHREEERWISWLRKAGFIVYDADPQSGDQWRVKGVRGHFGGSLDSIALMPYAQLAQQGFLFEFKTHKDSSFQKLKKEKVQRSKPTHYRQMCIYGRAYGFRYAVYCAINKNDDDIHVEVVKLDWRMGDDMFKRGDEIINDRVPPRRISDNSTFWACKACHLREICHFGADPEINCRSCFNAYPIDEGQWYCARYQAVPPEHVLKTGCQSWQRIA